MASPRWRKQLDQDLDQSNEHADGRERHRGSGEQAQSYGVAVCGTELDIEQQREHTDDPQANAARDDSAARPSLD
jgi:hypothetical protein